MRGRRRPPNNGFLTPTSGRTQWLAGWLACMVCLQTEDGWGEGWGGVREMSGRKL